MWGKAWNYGQNKVSGANQSLKSIYKAMPGRGAKWILILGVGIQPHALDQCIVASNRKDGHAYKIYNIIYRNIINQASAHI